MAVWQRFLEGARPPPNLSNAEILMEGIMTPLSREEVMAVLGPVDDILVARIIATGASYSDLAEAHAWIAADDTLMDTGQKLPTGLAGELVAILSRIEEEEDESPA